VIVEAGADVLFAFMQRHHLVSVRWVSAPVGAIE